LSFREREKQKKQKRKGDEMKRIIAALSLGPVSSAEENFCAGPIEHPDPCRRMSVRMIEFPSA
jgi:hypothetical protein